MASPRFNPSWSRLPAGTEIPELRTATSRTFCNGDGTFTAEISSAVRCPPAQKRDQSSGGADADSSMHPTSTGDICRWLSGGWHYTKNAPNLHYQHYFLGVLYLAFAEFDLTPIPDSSPVMSADLSYYQYEYEGTVTTKVTHAPIAPDSVDAELVYYAVRDGYVVAEGTDSYIGWVRRALNEGGITRLSQCRPQNRITLGILPVDGYGAAYGMRNDSLQTYLSVTYVGAHETDIQTIRAELVTYPMTPLGGPDTAEALFTNLGQISANDFKVCAIADRVICDSATVTALPPNETIGVRLSVPTLPTGERWATYRFAATDISDPKHENDTSNLACWSFPHGTYTAEGFDRPAFPPPGWTTATADTGNHSWEQCQLDPRTRTGYGFARSICENYIATDDWLMSGPAFPKQDDRDSVGFFTRCYGPAAPLTLEVWAMSGQQVGDTLSQLLALTFTHSTYTRHAVSLDTFDGDTIYIGFRNHTPSGWNWLCLDDIWFSRIFVPGTNEPAVGIPMRPTLTIEPNPTSGRFVTVRHGLGKRPTSKLTLRDVLGRTVRTVELDPSGSTRLDLRDIQPGVYVASLESVSPSVSRKLVVTAPR